MKQAAFLIIVTVILSACVSASKTGAYYSHVLKDLPPIPESESRLVVYHPIQWAGGGAFFVPLAVNGTEVCNLREGAFFVRDIKSGPFTLDASGDSMTTIQAVSQKQYYIKAMNDPTRVSTQPFLSAGGVGLVVALTGEAVTSNPEFMLSQVDEKAAYEELGNTKEELNCTDVKDYHPVPEQTPSKPFPTTK